MKVDLIVRLDDKKIEEITGTVDADDRLRLDKGISRAAFNEAADAGGTARITVVVRKHEDD